MQMVRLVVAQKSKKHCQLSFPFEHDLVRKPVPTFGITL
ncbi:hypothetical protein CES86_2062 [Brucella lupini]|uniref:Uncharacterized protein n=1 Tax=Brucella lupini TaxID=255457 RepID=A0A256GQX2_9HYPH|nr:hypothetical protein CES86_2062 [Brucella lupini]